MIDPRNDARGPGRSTPMPAHPIHALRLIAVAIACAATTAIWRYWDSLDTYTMRTRGEWPFRGPADGPRSVFTTSRRRADQR